MSVKYTEIFTVVFTIQSQHKSITRASSKTFSNDLKIPTDGVTVNILADGHYKLSTSQIAGIN